MLSAFELHLESSNLDEQVHPLCDALYGASSCANEKSCIEPFYF